MESFQRFTGSKAQPHQPPLSSQTKQPASLCLSFHRPHILGWKPRAATIPFVSIMSWLRRLSRDRASKTEQDFKMPARPTSFADQQSPPYKDTQYASTYNSQDRLGSSYRPTTAPQSESQHYNALPIQRPQEGSNTATAHNTPPSSMAQAPDPLTRAFNEAVRPYLDKIDRLEAEIEEKNLLPHIGA